MVPRAFLYFPLAMRRRGLLRRQQESNIPTLLRTSEYTIPIEKEDKKASKELERQVKN